MLPEALRMLFAYDRWATKRMLDTAGGLSAEQLLGSGSAGHGSVRDTLVHLLSAQRNWLGLCDGSLTAAQAFSQELGPADFPDIDAVRARFREVDAATQTYLSRLDSAESESRREGTFPWSGDRFSLPVWAILLHVINHGTQHRSEAAAMMTACGHSPGFVDLMGFTLGYLDPAAASA